MPLYAEDGSYCVLQCFDSTIRSSLGDGEMVSDLSAALVVGTVDDAGISIKMMQDGTVSTVHRMKLIVSDILMCLDGRKILNDITAEVYIDELNTFADA